MIKVIGHSRETRTAIYPLTRVETCERVLDCFTGEEVWLLGRYKDSLGRTYREVVQCVLFDGKGNGSYFLGFKRESDGSIFGWKINKVSLPEAIAFTYDSSTIKVSDNPEIYKYHIMDYNEAIELLNIFKDLNDGEEEKDHEKEF